MLLATCHSLVKQRENLSNLSSMRRSASLPDETLRRELKIQCTASSVFDELQGVSSGDETLCRMLDITSFLNIVFSGWSTLNPSRHILNSLKDLRINRIVNNDFL